MNKTVQLSLITTLLLNTNLFAEERLEDITVTSATKATQSLNEVTANIDVITAQELEERHYASVAEAINTLSGIDLNSNGGLGQVHNLYVRGFDNAKVLVLIDGIRYNDVSSTSGATLNHLMISEIEQIEIVKGPQSGIWGADASAGVINIITKEAKDGFSLSASQEFGSFDSVKTGANVAYKNDNFYFKASHNHTSTNGFSAYAPRNQNLNQFEDDGYSNDTTTLKAGLTITPTDKLDLTHTVIDSFTEADPYDSTIPGFNPNGEFNVDSKTELTHLNYHHIDSFNELNVFAKKSNFKRFYPQATSSQNFDGNVNEYGLTSKIPYANKHFILWGGDYKKFADKGSINKSYDNKAFFITNHNVFEGFFGGKTILTQSLRQDNYSDFDDKLTGKIGVKHISETIDGLSGSMNYGTAYNVPTHYHLYDAFSGNSNLNPENTKGYDVSLAYHDLKMTYFNNTIDNLIQYQSIFVNGNFAGGNFQNVAGKSKLKGFEVAYQKEVMDDILITTNYTNLSAKDKDGRDLARRADESLKFGIDYYGIEQLHLGLQGQYVGERFDRANKQGQQTGKYTTADFTANYEYDKQMSFYAKVVNVTDKDYQTVDGYATSPRAGYVGMRLSY